MGHKCYRGNTVRQLQNRLDILLKFFLNGDETWGKMVLAVVIPIWNPRVPQTHIYAGHKNTWHIKDKGFLRKMCFSPEIIA
jgi:hypothetical protein